MNTSLESMSREELVDVIERAINLIEIKAYEDGEEYGRYMEYTEAQINKEMEQKESDQDKRDRIIKQAKADIRNLALNPESKFYRVLKGFDSLICTVEFVVNKEKRTVVALLKGRSSGTIHAKGIAKAHPNDCFNVHIGMAIALNRALGNGDKEEYMNVPQPTEVNVGDIIYLINIGETFVVRSSMYINSVANSQLEKGILKVVDDSRVEDVND